MTSLVVTVRSHTALPPTQLLQPVEPKNHIISKATFTLNMDDSYNLVSWLYKGHWMGLDEGKDLLHHTLRGYRHLIEQGLPQRPNFKAIDEVIIGGHQGHMHYPI